LNKTLTALAVTGAVALSACGDKPASKVEVPEGASAKTRMVFRLDTFKNTSGFIGGYDTDGDSKTIEEAIIIRGRTYGTFSPRPIDLERLPRKDWQHLVAPGVSSKRYITDNTYTMTSQQQAIFNQVAQLTGYGSK
jgi:hypothetical protein